MMARLDPRLVAQVAAQLLKADDLRSVIETGALRQYGTLGTVKEHVLHLAAGFAADLVEACVEECKTREAMRPPAQRGSNARETKV